MNSERIFRRSDPDFPVTKAAQLRLVASGRVSGEGPFAKQAPALVAAMKGKGAPVAPLPVPDGASIPLGETDRGTLHLSLQGILAGRCLIQGSSGAGKSATLRHIIEEAHDYLTIMIVDPEGEFGNLAEHIGATSIKAANMVREGLTAAADSARHHRIPLHLDLSDCDPDMRIRKAAAFFAGLLASPREDWAHTVLIVIDEAHLLAPNVAGAVRDAETRRLGVATLTELCSRGRKRGISVIIATQRLAKLATSVTSELHNVLLGLNIFDRDVARAADLLGFGSDQAEALKALHPGSFFALGPALSPRPVLVRIAATVTRHTSFTPNLMAPGDVTTGEARALLNLDALQEMEQASLIEAPGPSERRTLDAFLLHPSAAAAARVMAALVPISPNATTAADLGKHLGIGQTAVHGALDLLSLIGAADVMPRGEARIARLSARVRRGVQDTAVVGLS